MKLFLSSISAILVVLFLSGCGIKPTATGWDYNSDGGKFEIPEYKPVDLTKYEYTKDLKFVEGKSFPCLSTEQTLTDYKTGEVSHIEAGRWGVCVNSSFFMSDHEVTNKEYRQFMTWAKKKAAADLLAKTYPEKRLPNGNYNEDIPIDWNDPVIHSELFIKLNNESFFNNSLLSYTIGEITRKYGSEQIDSTIKIYPDTTCIEEGLYLYRRSYWYNEKYDNYPVVGVSWLQANAYCLWRSDRLNEEVLLNNKVISKKSFYHTADALSKIHQEWLQSDPKKHAPVMFPSFSIPTEGEWIIATKPSNYESKTDRVFAWDGFVLTNEKDEFLANIKQDWFYSSDGYEFTAPVKSFRTKDLEIYDLCGNVSEWVLDSDSKDETLRVIKGGSWAGSIESLMIHKSELMPQTSSSSKIGFRVAMELDGSSLNYITK